jgi:hypothetical protein
MTDKPIYTEINGETVRIDKVDGRVTKTEQQEKLKVILRKMQKATVVDMGIDAAYIAVLELERREKGIPAEPRVGPVTVNVGNKDLVAAGAGSPT